MSIRPMGCVKHRRQARRARGAVLCHAVVVLPWCTVCRHITQSHVAVPPPPTHPGRCYRSSCQGMVLPCTHHSFGVCSHTGILLVPLPEPAAGLHIRGTPKGEWPPSFGELSQMESTPLLQRTQLLFQGQVEGVETVAPAPDGSLILIDLQGQVGAGQRARIRGSCCSARWTAGLCARRAFMCEWAPPGLQCLGWG